jgi:hypothetical protein
MALDDLKACCKEEAAQNEGKCSVSIQVILKKGTRAG